MLVPTPGGRLLVHLRMTGRLIVQPLATMPLERYTNAALDFDDGKRLCFADARQFGRMRVVAPDEPWDADVGIEPLSEGFTQACFTSLLSGRSTPIKTLLLDQRRIAGIGNI